MSLDNLRKFCATLPGATRCVRWGAEEAYSVGDKMFAIFWVEEGKAKTVSFKCDQDRFLTLIDQSGVDSTPYLARAHWVKVRDGKALSGAQSRELVARSHALALAKLTRKLQATIVDAASSPG